MPVELSRCSVLMMLARCHARELDPLRIVQSQLFIVPGGRYLVTSDGGFSLSVWDLGYVSTVECKLVSSVDLENDGHMKVQATPDGKGLVILWIYR